MTEYGAKGCRCWPEDELDVSTGLDGFITRIPGRWMPNASCPHHGLLAGMLAPRTDTGVYRVVRADDGTPTVLEPMEGVDLSVAHRVDRGCAEECTGCGVRQDFLGRCEECLEDADAWTVRHTLTPEEAKAMSEAMADPDAPRRRLPPRPTTEKEHGDLSTVRRWLRRFADWLDPHAAAVRDYRAEWRRQRTDLDGGEPRDQGWER